MRRAEDRMGATRLTLAGAAAIACLMFCGPGQAADAILTGSAAFGDWTKDAPGVWRHITPNDLPPPHHTASAEMTPTLVPRPAGTLPRVPAGFTVSTLVTGLEGPRVLRSAPNGDLFIAEMSGGRIRVLRPHASGRPAVFAEGLDRPFGIAFYPPGPNPRYVYVGTTKAILRFPYRAGDLHASGPAQVVVPNLPDGGHVTRDVLFTPDGKTMLVAIGSSSNVQDFGPEREVGRANILEFDPDGHDRRLYASGMRNPASIAFDPRTGELWAAVNERDLLGNDIPPDYVTHVRAGAFYGWPYYYIGAHRDTRPKGGTPPVAGSVTVPDVLIQAHSAPLGIAFYTGTQFPAEYRGDLFVALHGSWNRAPRTGYKIVRVKMQDGKATGAYQDFLTGLVAPNGDVWGRPVSLLVAPDGALLMSDDGSGTIWRIAYR